MCSKEPAREVLGSVSVAGVTPGLWVHSGCPRDVCVPESDVEDDIEEVTDTDLEE